VSSRGNPVEVGLASNHLQQERNPAVTDRYLLLCMPSSVNYYATALCKETLSTVALRYIVRVSSFEKNQAVIWLLAALPQCRPPGDSLLKQSDRFLSYFMRHVNRSSCGVLNDRLVRCLHFVWGWIEPRWLLKSASVQSQTSKKVFGQSKFCVVNSTRMILLCDCVRSLDLSTYWFSQSVQ